MGQQFGRRSWAEPWKIKMVEPIHMISREERAQALEEAGYNTFLLRSADVYIDLLTDSGTSAMSDRQWAGMMLGDEAYAGSRNFYHLEEAVQTYYGYRHLVPTHQGRGAEHLISQVAIKPGQYVPGNMYFTTTRLHQEIGRRHICGRDHRRGPRSLRPASIQRQRGFGQTGVLIEEKGAENIAYVSLAGTVNMAGGQPVSMANVKALQGDVRPLRIPVYLDATRMDENAYFIQQREEGYADKSVAEILKEFCSYTDGAWMSAKKDNLVNIGGWLAVNDQICLTACATWSWSMRGCIPMAAWPVAIWKPWPSASSRVCRMTRCAPAWARCSTWATCLLDWDIPIVQPVGGHAIFLDAKGFYPHIPQDQFPAQTLAAQLYLDSGVRSMERGIVSAGRDPKTGDHRYPALELTRLAIPRRVYTQAHMDVVAEAVKTVYDSREQTRGLKMVYEPK